MRWILGLALAAGCTSETATGVNGIHVVIESTSMADDGPMAWRSQYPTVAQGVYFTPAEGWAVAGMGGNTCRLQYSWGGIDVDEDMGEGSDTVWDGFPTGQGTDTVVIHGTDQIAYGDFPSGEVLWSLPAPGAIAARATSDAMVLLRQSDGCTIEWSGAFGAAAVSLDGAICDAEPSLELDDDGSTAWIAGGGQLVTVTADGALRRVATGVDRMARDAETGALYVAEDGANEIRAIGAVEWTASLPGSVIGFDAVGGAGAVVASVVSEDDDHLVVLDRADGRVLVDAIVPRAAGEIVGAPHGSGFAMIGRRGTDFFELGDLDALR